MKNAKKSLLAGAVLASVLGCGFCVPGEVQAAVNGFADGSLSYSDYTQLDKYLTGVTLTDYNYQQYLQSRRTIGMGACSAVWNDSYFGRNYDFFLDNSQQAVVKVPSAEGRFSSIGIGCLYYEGADLPETLNALSYTTVDGINENGVAITINVCTREDAEAHGGYISAGGTNPGKPELSGIAVVRDVLDNARAAEQIVGGFRNDVNIVNDFSLLEGIGMHFMIADKNKHYIVEFINNQLVVSEDTVMTNFFNTLHDKAIAAGHKDTDGNGIETFVKDGADANYRQEYPHGVERYKVLKQYYDDGKLSMEDMAKLMQRVRYRQVYRSDILDADHYFYSEEASPYTYTTIEDVYNDKSTYYNAMKAEWDPKWAAGKTWDDFRGTGIWQTVNTSVYDLNKLKLLLYIQEQYDRAFNFSLTVQDIMGVGSPVAGNNVLTALYQGDGDSAGSKFVRDMVNSTTYMGGVPTMGKPGAAKMLNAVSNMGEAAGVLHGTVAMLNSFSDNICSQMSLTGRPSVAEGTEKGKRIWADYIHSKEKVDGLALCGIDANYDMQINGFTAGAELWNHKNNLGGVAIMYASGNTNGFSGGVSTRNEMDYYGIGIYNRKDFRNNWSILYDLSYTHSKNDIRQYNHNQEITAKPKTNSFGVGVRAEKIFGDAKAQVTPFVGLRYNMIKSEGYSNNLGIDYDTRRMNVFNVPIGIKFSCATRSRGWSFSPYAEVAYIRNFGDTDNRTEMSYGGVSDSFGYDVLDKGAWSAKAGISVAKDNLSFNIGYNHVKSSNSHNNRWHIGLNVSF
ncbi:MAG: autotransporter domain-containing protein [Acidaminococcaceae bacterium]|nr:autotransporter domain-containing protein [Acidaminococcaceae bacterium]